jgi:hypothetical protein
MTPEQAKHNLSAMGNPRMIGADFTGNEYYGLPKNPGIQFIGGQTDWKNERQDAKSYKITITNTGTSAEDKHIALCPAFYTAAGSIVVPNATTIDAIIADGTIDSTSGKEVVCTGAPMSVASFKDYILNNPTRFTKIQIRSNNAEQLQELIQVIKVNPFTGLSPEQISPATYLKEANNNDKLVTFYLNDLQLDRQTILYLKVLAGATFTITLWPGATVNNAAELAVEALRQRGAGVFNHEALNA